MVFPGSRRPWRRSAVGRAGGKLDSLDRIVPCLLHIVAVGIFHLCLERRRIVTFLKTLHWLALSIVQLKPLGQSPLERALDLPAIWESMRWLCAICVSVSM